jgi:hypothetical protein
MCLGAGLGLAGAKVVSIYFGSYLQQGIGETDGERPEGARRALLLQRIC